MCDMNSMTDERLPFFVIPLRTVVRLSRQFARLCDGTGIVQYIE